MGNVIFRLIIVAAITQAFGYDNIPASFKHPGSLPLDSVPQFVCFGFDDNCYTDGVKWVDNLFRNKKNPDNYPARVTFYVSTHPTIVDKVLWASIDSLYLHGHEIGNHTQRHDADIFSANLNSKDLWNTEISGATNDLYNQSNIPKNTVIGFRTPFLLYSAATFECMKPNGIIYDCSIEHGLGQYQDPVTMAFQCGEIWPYTLDQGKHQSAYGSLSSKIPGLWILPVHEYLPATGWTGITGLDYNVWGPKSMRKDAALALWKSSLNIRFKGDSARQIVPNRAPLFMGMHSDEYTDANTDPAIQAWPAKTAERRAAVSEFLDYALAYNPAIRVVPLKAVIDWMRSPVPYSQYHYDPNIITGIAGTMVNSKHLPVSARFAGKMIVMNLPVAGNRNLYLYDLSGRCIADLGNRLLAAGENCIPITGMLPGGIYVLTISGVSESFKLIKK